MGGEEGDSLVDGQKDKGKRVTGICQRAGFGDEETNRYIKDNPGQGLMRGVQGSNKVLQNVLKVKMGEKREGRKGA